MDILNEGTEDLNQMASLNCCWPPGTELTTYPDPQ